MAREPFDPDRVPLPDLDPRTNELSNMAIGAAIEVHRHLGPGHIESVYHRAVCLEQSDRNIDYAYEFPYDVLYKGRLVGECRFDVVIERCLVMELKAVDRLAPIHAAQLRFYLQASKLRLGLLINFNVLQLKDGIQRVIN